MPALTFKGKPILAYGPSPQHILTYLPRGSGDDYADWLSWAKRYRMRNVRSYPPSTVVETPAINLFQRAARDPGKFDLKRFNNAYFNELRRACKEFEKAGVIVHLQLWQAVKWKKAWAQSYYNPANNVNPDISRHAGPNQFSTMANPILLKHQIAYVDRILDATADIGNVFYDIMNEIGNGTSPSRKWVDAIVESIRKWEKRTKVNVLLTLNDEGGKRLGDFSLNHPQLDLIVKDLGRYEEHMDTRMHYGKPTISVRNIDFNYINGESFYFFGENNLEINSDPQLQARGRKYWWRMYMAGVAAAAGYADSISSTDRPWEQRFASMFPRKIDQPETIKSQRIASYRLDTLAETNFLHFINFVELAGDRQGLQAGSGVVAGHPVANSYCLQNDRKAVIYMESPNGEAGHIYPEGNAKLIGLHLRNGSYNLLVYHPGTGEQATGGIQISNGEGFVQLPSFRDDLAVIIRRSPKN
jgi:hypothetical protein